MIRRGLILALTLAAAGTSAQAQDTSVPSPLLPSGSTTLPDVPPPNPADSLLDEIELPPAEGFRETPRMSTPGSTILDQPFRTGPRLDRRPDSISERVRFRKARTLAMKDPAVAEAFAIIDLAKTDPVKMERRYRFYHLLFARMRKIDRHLSMLKQVEADTYVRLQGSIIPAENRAVIRQREE